MALIRLIVRWHKLQTMLETNSMLSAGIVVLKLIMIHANCIKRKQQINIKVIAIFLLFQKSGYYLENLFIG